MQRALTMFLLGGMAWSVLSSSEVRSDDEDGFITIFDGKTLKGFRAEPGRWRVEEGAIVGEIPVGQTLRHNTWLVWEGGQLDDFELRLEFRLSGKPRANSGIQFRCQVDSVTRVSGYQADLDMGATWLGRIYDEHGRALLVERGTRVLIQENGQRVVQSFAKPDRYAVLFREDDWNEYRIRACGEHMSVDINGTLFSQLVDRQTGERDLSGQLAFQLHSGSETRIEFRKIRYRKLKPDEHRVQFKPAAQNQPKKDAGVIPPGPNGKPLNLGFEDGTLSGWTARGTAFQGQPIQEDTIASRWPGQASQKVGQYFIGGFELGQDQPVGELISDPFDVTHPYASFLIGGGARRSTRCEIVLADGSDRVIHTASGINREEMNRVLVDLQPYLGKPIQVRLVDHYSGGWGHLNFDDFRFHATSPSRLVERASPLEVNPLLSQLQPNPHAGSHPGAAAQTVRRMHLPAGFVAEVIAAEPQLHQPMAFTFDARGRIWVVEGHSYPQKRPSGEGLDRILIFSDEDGDGQFETRKVFTEGLNLVSGLEVGYGGVWIGAAPQLLFIPDANRDDQPDSPPQVLLDGFGFQDTHETLNSFIWGPDGWLYGNQGVFNVAHIGKPGASDEDRIELRAGVWRYHPVRHQFEVFAHGGSNQWGLDFNECGQLFMTHCRSRWGRGPTTHVIQGGRYWNQTNRNYAPFVSARAPVGYPYLRNYMLASARYGHGEGGAGKSGSRAVYGGHAHVGTMIYLGDNWPDRFRDHLLTHNLHGRQINHQVNRRDGSGYQTVHAGQDLLFCDDAQFIGVDLKYGPDGAVYMTDWYDQRLCHNPNVEQWDRANGRMYRMAFANTFQPKQVNLLALDDLSLVESFLHKNDWHVRTARRLLHERAVQRGVSSFARARLIELTQNHPQPTRRLRGLWGLHAIGELDEPIARKMLEDPDESLRAWTIQLLAEDGEVSRWVQSRWVDLARSDPSPMVRLYLASALNRLDDETAWQIADALSQHAEDAADRNLPRMIWYGLAPRMPHDLERAFRLADRSQIPDVSRFVHWYAAKEKGDGLEHVVWRIADAQGPSRQQLLEETYLALEGQHPTQMPRGWPELSTELYQHDDPRVRLLAEKIGAVFGDDKLAPRMRRILADRESDPASRRHAFEILAEHADRPTLPLLLQLLDDAAFRSDAIRTLARYDEPAIGEMLVQRFAQFADKDRTAALDTLTSRESWAHALLDAIVEGQIEKDHLSEYYVRHLVHLSSKSIDERLAQQWGKVESSSAEKMEQIAQLEGVFTQSPLWAYSAPEGRKHFQKLCSSCHRVDNEGTDVGPKLAGSGGKGVRYFAENIIDPNAVIGADYLSWLIATDDGRVLSGLIQQTTDTTIRLRTATAEVVLPRSEIEMMKKTQQSLMPEGMLQQLNERQVIELLKYLSSI